MTRYSNSDWLILLGAYSYELANEPILTDRLYDELSKGKVNIKFFEDYTGSWIYKLFAVENDLQYVLRSICMNFRIKYDGLADEEFQVKDHMIPAMHELVLD